MSRSKHNQQGHAVKVAPVAPSKVEPETIAPVEVPVAPVVPKLFRLKVNGLWMTCFHTLAVSDDESKAALLTADNAYGFARHIEFRKKGRCEVVPV
jgi:hypothetical protein